MQSSNDSPQTRRHRRARVGIARRARSRRAQSLARIVLLILTAQLGIGPVLHAMIEPIFHPSTARFAADTPRTVSTNPTLSPPCDNPAHHHGVRTARRCPFCAWSNSVHLQTPPIGAGPLTESSIGVVRDVVATCHHRLARFEAPPRAPPATL